MEGKIYPAEVHNTKAFDEFQLFLATGDYRFIRPPQEVVWEYKCLPDVVPRKPSTFIATPEPGRNELCPCGSNKKYKKCCGKL